MTQKLAAAAERIARGTFVGFSVIARKEEYGA
jgi:hypothetical protein